MTSPLPAGRWARLRRKRAAVYWRLSSLIRALTTTEDRAHAVASVAQDIDADLVVYTLAGEQLASPRVAQDLGPSMRTLLHEVRSLTLIDDVPDPDSGLGRAMRKHGIAAIFPFYRSAERGTGADPAGWVMLCGPYDEYLYANDDAMVLEGLIAHCFDAVLDQSVLGVTRQRHWSSQTAAVAPTNYAFPGGIGAVYLGRDRAMMSVLRRYFPALKHYVAPSSKGFLSHPPPPVVFYDRREASIDDDKALQEQSLATSRDGIVCMVFGMRDASFEPKTELRHVQFVVTPDIPDPEDIAKRARHIVSPDTPVDQRLPTLQAQLCARERELLEQYLAICGHNKPQAAALAGLPLASLLRKVKKYGLT